MEVRLSIIISTISSRIGKLESEWYPCLEGIEYILVWQKPFGNEPAWVEKRSDFYLITSEETGLAKSRNLGIAKSHGDACYIADDDVRFGSWGLKSLLSELDTSTEDFYVVKVRGSLGAPFRDYRSFSPFMFEGKRFVLSICSVEMCFRKKVWNSVKFNEKIGLGTDFPIGEDTLFSFQAYNKGFKFKLSHVFVAKLLDDNHTGGSRDCRVLFSQGVFAAYIWSKNPLFWGKKIMELMRDMVFFKSYRRFYYYGIVSYLLYRRELILKYF